MLDLVQTPAPAGRARPDHRADDAARGARRVRHGRRSGPRSCRRSAEIRARFNRRREGGNPVERLVRRLLGHRGQAAPVRRGAQRSSTRVVDAGRHGRASTGSGRRRRRCRSSPSWPTRRLGGPGTAPPRPAARRPTDPRDGGRRSQSRRGSRVAGCAVRSPRSGCVAGAAGRRAAVLVACSGGADSLALAAATAFVAPRLGIAAGLVTVDHGLQAGSAEPGDAVAGWAGAAGFDPVLVAGRRGRPPAARRRPPATPATRRCAGPPAHGAAVLLGHTRDDQAETVLLGAGPGRRAAGVAGMRRGRRVAGSGRCSAIRRETTRAACARRGSRPWDDPHNVDPAYARVRRAPRCCPGSRTRSARRRRRTWPAPAELLRADVDALDGLAAARSAPARRRPAGRRPGRPSPGRSGPGCCRPGSRWGPGSACRPRCRAGRPGRRLARPGPGRPAAVRGRDGQASRLACCTSPDRTAERRHRETGERCDRHWYDADIERVVVTEEQIRDKIDELAKQVAADYADREACCWSACSRARIVFMADFARALAAVAAGRDGVHGGLLVRPAGDLVRGGAHPQGPRPGHRRPARDRGRGHRRLRADPVLAAEVPGEPVGRVGRGGRAAAQAGRGQGRGCRCGTSASTSRTSSSSATGWTIAERYRELPYIGRLKPAVYTR